MLIYHGSPNWELARTLKLAKCSTWQADNLHKWLGNDHCMGIATDKGKLNQILKQPKEMPKHCIQLHSLTHNLTWWKHQRSWYNWVTTVIHRLVLCQFTNTSKISLSGTTYSCCGTTHFMLCKGAPNMLLKLPITVSHNAIATCTGLHAEEHAYITLQNACTVLMIL